MNEPGDSLDFGLLRGKTVHEIDPLTGMCLQNTPESESSGQVARSRDQFRVEQYVPIPVMVRGITVMVGGVGAIVTQLLFDGVQEMLGFQHLHLVLSLVTGAELVDLTAVPVLAVTWVHHYLHYCIYTVMFLVPDNPS